METIKKIIARAINNATVKGKIMSLVGIIIIIRWLYGFILSGSFSFTNDAPMVLFGVFLFTVKDPAFIKELIKKLL